MEDWKLVKCCFCKCEFEPIPVILKSGKKKRTYIECPNCGNGIERAYRSYDKRKVR